MNPFQQEHTGRPGWLAEGVVFAGHWEPLVFRRRRGGLRTNEAARYAREHSAEALAQLQAAGCNLVITHFDKGFGLTAQAEDMALTREWADRLHRAGIRVGVYIRYDTLIPDTLQQDQPDVESWIARTADGDQPIVLRQTFRKAACPSAAGHQAYIEQLVRLAVEEVHADLIHFDGFWIGHEAQACHCPRCLDGFTHFLRTRYPTAAAARERFGHSALEGIRPPTYHPHGAPLARVVTLDDPAAQEWVAYRCQTTAEILRRFAGLIRMLNPDVAVEVNTLIPVGSNHAYYWGFELPLLAPFADALWTEDDHWAGYRADGVIISRIREFKIGRALDTLVFSYQAGRTEEDLKLSLAQAMAFNAPTIGELGSPLLAEEPFYQTKCEIIAWFRRHVRRFANAAPANDVALWRSQRSLAYNVGAPHRSAVLCEQMLIQGRVPFDIIFDAHLADLSAYRAIVLPDAECVSDDQLDVLRRFVAAGGGLVATEDTARYDEWRRRRPDSGLRDVLGPDAVLPVDSRWRPFQPLGAAGAALSLHHAGQGRAAFLPALLTARPTSVATGSQPAAFPTEAWELPRNSADFLRAVRWVAGGRLSAEVQAPDGVAIEVLRQADGTTLLHLVNYRVGQPAAGIQVEVRVPPGSRVRQVLVLPLEEEERPVPFVQVGDWVSCEVPIFTIYSIVIVEEER